MKKKNFLWTTYEDDNTTIEQCILPKIIHEKTDNINTNRKGCYCVRIQQKICTKKQEYRRRLKIENRRRMCAHEFHYEGKGIADFSKALACTDNDGLRIAGKYFSSSDVSRRKILSRRTRSFLSILFRYQRTM